MRDFIGNEINIGDTVVLHGGIRLMKAEVTGFHDYWGTVNLKDLDGFISNSYPSDLIVVTSIISNFNGGEE